MQIERRVVAVTGGARGIGAAVAKAATEQGALVAIGDVDTAAAERTAKQFFGLALPLDVTNHASWAAFITAVEEQLGGVDVLVNNAGIMPIGPFLEETDAATQRQLEINVLGVLLGCRAVLPGMLARGRGHLINIASMAGKMGVAGAVTYCGSKFAVVGLTQALTDELRNTPVSASCVLPGLVNTDLSLGLPRNRLAREVEPSDIADAVMATIAKPRSEVWVPASGRVSFKLAGLLSPRQRHQLMHMCGLDDPMLTADGAARASYEARIAAGNEAGDVDG